MKLITFQQKSCAACSSQHHDISRLIHIAAWGQNKHVADIEALELVAPGLLVPFMNDWMMKEDMKLSDGMWYKDTKSKGFKRRMLNLRWICYRTPPLGDCKGPQNTQCRWPWCWGSSVLVGKWLGKQQIVIVEHVHPISCRWKDDPMALPMSICSSRSLPQERVLSASLVAWELARVICLKFAYQRLQPQHGSTPPGLRGLSWSRRWPTKAFATTWSTKRWICWKPGEIWRFVEKKSRGKYTWYHPGTCIIITVYMQIMSGKLWLLQIKWILVHFMVFQKNR